MIRSARKKTIFLIATAIIMLACVPTLAPAPTPFPTFDPNSLGTFIVETANAAATQTELVITPSATPTFTHTPTKTPSDTPTPTATFLYLIPTQAATVTLSNNQSANVNYACSVLAQSPADNSLIGPGSPFSVRWQVKNIGLVAWESSNIDYRYKSGAKMHVQPAYDLYKNAAIDDVVDIIVDMTAPTTPGSYTTSWRMRAGKQEFCPLSLTINVK